MMALTAPQNVIVEVSTFAPGRSRSARSAISIPAVHDETATACLAPTRCASSRSNSRTSGPVVIHPEARTRAEASRASALISALANGMRVATDDWLSAIVIAHPKGPTGFLC